MIDFLVQKLNDDEISHLVETVLDIGTGNGHLLFQLKEEFEEYVDNQPSIENIKYIGVDYSSDSVEFAAKIQTETYPDEQAFLFAQVDILSKQERFVSDNKLGFDILLDKGTLDAIALNQDAIAEWDGKIGMDVYPIQVSKLMNSRSIFLITSCNFTETELIKIITEDGQNDLEVWDKINYPSFQFGGVQGSTICSIAFKKKNQK